MSVTGQRDRLLAVLLFALLFSVYLLTFSGTYHSSDEMSMLAVTDSLARRGQWDIELLRWMGEQQGSFGPDGQLYSRKGIGTSLAALPLYWLAVQSPNLGNVQTAMLTNGLITALTGVLVYLFLRRLGYVEGISLGVALGFGLGTMAWPYARFLFSESLAGFGLMLSAYFLLPAPNSSSAPNQDETRLRAEDPMPSFLAGVGLGIALLARLNNAIVAPFLGLALLVYLYRRHGRNWRAWSRPIILFGLPVLVALGIIGWYNWLRFGSPLTTGYLPEERFATPFLEGFYGLTFSPGKGLFWYNPLFFAALVAWPAFVRRHRVEALLAGAIVLSNVAFYAPWYLWWAGHAWGPRFLVTILPFAALPLAPAIEIARRKRWLASVLMALAAVSIVVQLLGVVVDFNLYLEEIHARLGLYHPDTLFNPAYSPLLRQFDYLGLKNLDLAWARGGTLNWPALLVGLVLISVSGLALWFGHAHLQQTDRHRWQRAWTSVALLLLLGLGTAGLMYAYAPTGDMAEATRTLEAMERPGEMALLANLLLTEAFQDSYTGRLKVQGSAPSQGFESTKNAIWVISAEASKAAEAQFRVGTVQLDLQLPQDRQFDTARLPVSLWPEDTRLGTALSLIAVQLDQLIARPGETLPLTLYWRALAPMNSSYIVFVQIIDEERVKAGQVDRLPCDGGCPTNTWRSGDLIGEWYDVPIRADAAPGRYQLIAGMYDQATGERLPLLDSQGTTTSNFVQLGIVEIRP